METLAAAFTDHLPLCIRLAVVEPIMRRGPGYWKMDARILEDKTIIERYKTYGTVSEDSRTAFIMARYGGEILQKEDAVFISQSTGIPQERPSYNGKLLL